MYPNQHADAIRTLPSDTQKIVIEALRVMAMDFVVDRTGQDALSDLSADISRELNPDVDFSPEI